MLKKIIRKIFMKRNSDKTWRNQGRFCKSTPQKILMFHDQLKFNIDQFCEINNCSYYEIISKDCKLRNELIGIILKYNNESKLLTKKQICILINNKV